MADDIDADDFIISENFRPAKQFRWVMPERRTTEKAKLQQLWQGSLGSQEWETIPIIFSDKEYYKD